MAALMILESTVDEERPAEEEGIPAHIFPSGLVIRILTIGMRLSHVESHDKLEYNASNTVGL